MTPMALEWTYRGWLARKHYSDDDDDDDLKSSLSAPTRKSVQLKLM
jgi:hypothetical protein